MKDDDLRECPFCGKLEAVIRKWGDTVESVCGYCGCCGPAGAVT